MSRLLLSLLLALLLGGCSLPRLIILNDPLDARQHNDLGVAYQQRGELDLALREYERAGELDSNWAQPLINRGNVLAVSEDWSGAQKSYRQALRRAPGNAEAMNNLAWVLLQAGDLPQALNWAGQALQLQPQNPAFLDTLAEIQLAAGEFAAARQTIEQALALDPSPDLRQGLEQKRSRLSAAPRD